MSSFQQFQSWLYNNQLNLPDEFSTGRGVVTAAVNNLSWGNNVALDLVNYLRTRNGASTIVAPFALMLAALIAHLCRWVRLL